MQFQVADCYGSDLLGIFESLYSYSRHFHSFNENETIKRFCHKKLYNCNLASKYDLQNLFQQFVKFAPSQKSPPAGQRATLHHIVSCVPYLIYTKTTIIAENMLIIQLKSILQTLYDLLLAVCLI